MIGLELDPAPLLGAMLASLRVGVLLLILPILGGGLVPARIRVLLSFAIGFALAPTVTQIPQDGVQLALASLRELALGATMGLVCRFLLMAPLMAGDLVAQELGLRMAQDVDPSAQVPATAIGRLYETAVFLAFLGANVHRDLVGALHRSFEHHPVGAAGVDFSPEPLLLALRESLRIAVQMALPMFAVMTVSSIVLAVIARTVPQLHVMNFGFALRMIGGLVALAVLFPWIAPPAEALMGTLRRQLAVVAGA